MHSLGRWHCPPPVKVKHSTAPMSCLRSDDAQWPSAPSRLPRGRSVTSERRNRQAMPAPGRHQLSQQRRCPRDRPEVTGAGRKREPVSTNLAMAGQSSDSDRHGAAPPEVFYCYDAVSRVNSETAQAEVSCGAGARVAHRLLRRGHLSGDQAGDASAFTPTSRAPARRS